MRIKDYLKDKYLFIFTNLFIIIFLGCFLYTFKVNIILIIISFSLLIIVNIFFLIYDYLVRNKFYKDLYNSLEKLDQKYLITELVNPSSFSDSKYFYDILSDIDKSMHENVNKYMYDINDFKDYLELWCHEIKTPIAVLKLLIENKNISKEYSFELDKVDKYIEQVMYYAKSNTLNEDYIIKEYNLIDIINDSIKNNKNYLLSKKIKININGESTYIKTDSKWLLFILDQIIINSIKYSSDSPYINFNIISNKNNVVLEIIDNGIGIDSNDIDNVFKKGFTGINGRKVCNSTGIGLFLVKKLIDKLNHNILIESRLEEYTKVSIIFPDNNIKSLTKM